MQELDCSACEGVRCLLGQAKQLPSTWRTCQSNVTHQAENDEIFPLKFYQGEKNQLENKTTQCTNRSSFVPVDGALLILSITVLLYSGGVNVIGQPADDCKQSQHSFVYFHLRFFRFPFFVVINSQKFQQTGDFRSAVRKLYSNNFQERVSDAKLISAPRVVLYRLTRLH